MSTMNISLPEELKRFIDDKVTGGRYSTSSEYIRDLIRREQDREQFRALIQEGLDSPAELVDDDYFTELHRLASGE